MKVFKNIISTSVFFLFHILSLPPHTLPKSHRNIMCTFLKFAFFLKAILGSDSAQSMESGVQISRAVSYSCAAFLFSGWGGAETLPGPHLRLRMCLTRTEAPFGLVRPGAFEARPSFGI